MDFNLKVSNRSFVSLVFQCASAGIGWIQLTVIVKFMDAREEILIQSQQHRRNQFTAVEKLARLTLSNILSNFIGYLHPFISFGLEPSNQLEDVLCVTNCNAPKRDNRLISM